MSNDFISKARGEMDSVIDIVREDLGTVKTGRAKPDLISQVQVEVYNSRMPLFELAIISAPDPQLLVVRPWDETVIENVERAISKSELNLNPVVDGSLIRIAIPALTEERREEMVTLVHQKLESGRVLLRQVRQETKKEIEAKKGSPGVSEDDIHLWMEDLEDLVKEYLEKIKELGKTKEEELLTI